MAVKMAAFQLLLLLCIFMKPIQGSPKSIAPLKVSKDNGYSDGVLLKLSDMQKDGLLTDFTFKVQKVSIPCHKVVLSAASQYFKSLFNSDGKNGERDGLILDTMNEHVMTNIIQYIYGQDILIQWQDIMEYLDAVNLFQLTKLKQHIEDYVIDHIDPDNPL